MDINSPEFEGIKKSLPIDKAGSSNRGMHARQEG